MSTRTRTIKIDENGVVLQEEPMGTSGRLIITMVIGKGEKRTIEVYHLGVWDGTVSWRWCFRGLESFFNKE